MFKAVTFLMLVSIQKLKNFSLFASGHSMGGHGAMVCHLKNPGMYSSVSAFAPICNPSAVPWGEKAFTGTHPNRLAEGTRRVKGYNEVFRSRICIRIGMDPYFGFPG